MINKLSILFFTLIFTFSCNKSEKLNFVEISGKTMGTTYLIKFEEKESIDPKIISKEIEKQLLNFNQICSTYIEDSEISKINENKLYEAIASEEFIFLFKEGKKLFTKTEGEFNPTIGPLVNLYGFGPKKTVESPSDADISKAKRAVGFRHFKLIGKKFSKLNPDSYLDFSAFAKGRGVDLIFDYLNNLGFENIFVEIGGEIRVKGSQKTWKVGIERPSDGQRSAFKIVPIKSGAIATSGDYRNYRLAQNKKVSHGISFKSGHPKSNDIASVSVVANSSMVADAWATALLVSGLDSGLKLANKNEIKAYFIYRAKGKTNSYMVESSNAWEAIFGSEGDR